LTINKATLTITANSASKIYDGLAYGGGNGVTYVGLVNNETTSALTGVLSYGGSSQGAINAGNYAIAPGGLGSGNYDIHFYDGTLVITGSAPVISSVQVNVAADAVAKAAADAAAKVVADAAAKVIADAKADAKALADAAAKAAADAAARITTDTTAYANADADADASAQTDTSTKAPASSSSTTTATATVAATTPAEVVAAVTMAVGVRPALNTPAAPTTAQLAQTPVVQQEVRTMETAVASGSVHNSIVTMATQGSLSMPEQKAVFAGVSSVWIVASLLADPSPIAKAVGAELKAVAGGDLKVQYADVKKVLAASGADPMLARTYLGLYQVVQRQAMTRLLSGALSELRQNPRAASVGITGGTTGMARPGAGQRGVSGITATGGTEVGEPAVAAAMAGSFKVERATLATDKAGNATLKGKIDNWVPGWILSSLQKSWVEVADLTLARIEDLLGPQSAQLHQASLTELAEAPSAAAAPARLPDWTGGRQVRLNGRWLFVHDDGSFDIPLKTRGLAEKPKLTIIDDQGLVREQIIEVDTAGMRKTQPQAAGKPRKVAVLFANNVYQHAELPSLGSPGRDAALVAGELSSRFGFETRIIANATKDSIVGALRALHGELSERDQVVLYYAGHGYEDDQTGVGYWLPTDAETDSAGHWLSTKDVATMLRGVPAKNIMVFADSCYSGSFTKEQRVETAGRPANIMELSELRGVIAMSSGGDEPVMDGAENSPFARALAGRLKTMPAISLGEELFVKVRDDVAAETPQTPQYGVVSSAGYDRGADYFFEAQSKRISSR
ncbi:MAG: caspase family protein, partial [Rhodospirillaceae bacterium]